MQRELFLMYFINIHDNKDPHSLRRLSVAVLWPVRAQSKRGAIKADKANITETPGSGPPQQSGARCRSPQAPHTRSR
jgi:hypothetical protein